MLPVVSIILTVMEEVIQYAPLVFDTVDEMMPFAKALYKKITGQDITDEQEQELFDALTTLHNEFQTPIPE